MSYRINLANVSLDDYITIMKNYYQIPSTHLLRDHIDEVISKVKVSGITNLEDLTKAIKSKSKALAFGDKYGIEEELIIILRRTANSYINKPRKLEDYPTMDTKLVEALSIDGITDTMKLYQQLIDLGDKGFASHYSLSKEVVEHVKSLVSVTRLRYVSPVFATLLVDSGFVSVTKIADTSYDEIYELMRRKNKETNRYKGNIGRKDARFLQEDAMLFERINGPLIF